MLLCILLCSTKIINHKLRGNQMINLPIISKVNLPALVKSYYSWITREEIAEDMGEIQHTNFCLDQGMFR